MFKKSILSLFLILSLAVSPAIAHPGRTDSSGGHYVRTSGWGYPVGSYHYHNGGYSNNDSSGDSSGYSTKKTSNKKKTASKKTKNNATKKKLIIGVDVASVKSSPELWAYDLVGITYGYEIVDLGGTSGWKTINHQGYYGYVPNSVVIQYNVISPKTVTIKPDVGYLFYAPNAQKYKAHFTKGTKLTAIGQANNWYYVKYTDQKGKTKFAFVSKTVVS